MKIDLEIECCLTMHKDSNFIFQGGNFLTALMKTDLEIGNLWPLRLVRITQPVAVILLIDVELCAVCKSVDRWG